MERSLIATAAMSPQIGFEEQQSPVVASNRVGGVYLTFPIIKLLQEEADLKASLCNFAKKLD